MFSSSLSSCNTQNGKAENSSKLLALGAERVGGKRAEGVGAGLKKGQMAAEPGARAGLEQGKVCRCVQVCASVCAHAGANCWVESMEHTPRACFGKNTKQ